MGREQLYGDIYSTQNNGETTLSNYDNKQRALPDWRSTGTPRDPSKLPSRKEYLDYVMSSLGYDPSKIDPIKRVNDLFKELTHEDIKVLTYNAQRIGMNPKEYINRAITDRHNKAKIMLEQEERKRQTGMIFIKDAMTQYEKAYTDIQKEKIALEKERRADSLTPDKLKDIYDKADKFAEERTKRDMEGHNWVSKQQGGEMDNKTGKIETFQSKDLMVRDANGKDRPASFAERRQLESEAYTRHYNSYLSRAIGAYDLGEGGAVGGGGKRYEGPMNENQTREFVKGTLSRDIGSSDSAIKEQALSIIKDARSTPKDSYTEQYNKDQSTLQQVNDFSRMRSKNIKPTIRKTSNGGSEYMDLSGRWKPYTLDQEAIKQVDPVDTARYTQPPVPTQPQTQAVPTGGVKMPSTPQPVMAESVANPYQRMEFDPNARIPLINPIDVAASSEIPESGIDLGLPDWLKNIMRPSTAQVSAYE